MVHMYVVEHKSFPASARTINSSEIVSVNHTVDGYEHSDSVIMVETGETHMREVEG